MSKFSKLYFYRELSPTNATAPIANQNIQNNAKFLFLNFTRHNMQRPYIAATQGHIYILVLGRKSSEKNKPATIVGISIIIAYGSILLFTSTSFILGHQINLSINLFNLEAGRFGSKFNGL